MSTWCIASLTITREIAGTNRHAGRLPKTKQPYRKHPWCSGAFMLTRSFSLRTFTRVIAGSYNTCQTHRHHHRTHLKSSDTYESSGRCVPCTRCKWQRELYWLQLLDKRQMQRPTHSGHHSSYSAMLGSTMTLYRSQGNEKIEGPNQGQFGNDRTKSKLSRS